MRYAILFQGQGKYKTDFVRSLYKKDEKSKEIFRRTNDIIDINVSDLLNSIEDASELDTEYAQLLVFMMEYVAYKYYEEKLMEKPSVVAGHSLGEITALTVAEGIKFEDSIKLVYQRGKIMKFYRGERQEGMMSIRNIAYDKIEEACINISKTTDYCVVCANYNSSSQIVLSGHVEALNKIKNVFGNEKCKFLDVQGAFHSPLMKEASVQLEKVLNKMEFYPLKIPVLSSVTGQLYPNSWSIGYILIQQLTRPVLWNNVMEYLENKGISTFAQVTNSQLFRSLDRCYPANHIWMQLEDYCNGKIYDYSKLYHLLKDPFRNQVPVLGEILLHFIAYPWKKESSMECIEFANNSYQKILELYIILADENKEIEKQQLVESINLLKTVLKHKDTGREDAKIIINEILNKYGLNGLI